MRSPGPKLVIAGESRRTFGGIEYVFVGSGKLVWIENVLRQDL
jgi:hypothetical protein